MIIKRRNFRLTSTWYFMAFSFVNHFIKGLTFITQIYSKYWNWYLPWSLIVFWFWQNSYISSELYTHGICITPGFYPPLKPTIPRKIQTNSWKVPCFVWARPSCASAKREKEANVEEKAPILKKFMLLITPKTSSLSTNTILQSAFRCKIFYLFYYCACYDKI